jgi:hypothetical protein
MFRMLPILNVVVYLEPGPDDDCLESDSIQFVMRESQWPLNGGLAYVVLQRAAFLQIRAGIRAGDAVGTAAGILGALGPQVRGLIGRPREFVYGWNAKTVPKHGEVLMLQVFSRAPDRLTLVPARADAAAAPKPVSRSKRR